MIFHTIPSFLKHCPANPVLTVKDIPFECCQVYNAGVTKFHGKYVMVFRCDQGRSPEAFRQAEEEAARSGKPMRFPPVEVKLGLAVSDDGIRWDVQREPIFEHPIPGKNWIYDPRLTVIDGRCYMCFAYETLYGVCGGIAVTDDFDKFEILYTSVPDNRNMVLFPEKINGNFMRLERPFPVYSRVENEAFDIWMGESPDCRYWGGHRRLLGAEEVPYCNSKLGPGAPPVKTPYGWLTTLHAVYKVDHELNAWHRNWNKVYYGGIMLLDLENPSKILGLAEKPLLVPELDYEVNGMRGSVIFPGGMILEDSGEVKIYYGAADTVECLAVAHLDDLLAMCKPFNRVVG